MKSDVANFINRCHTCLVTKPEQKAPQGLLGKQPDVTKPWQMISVDLVGPLPKSTKGFCYIFSVIDVFTKFVMLFPLRSATASAILPLLEDHIFLLFGCPQFLICDNGSQFRSREFRDLARKYGIELRFTPNYNPQSNPVERTHRVLKTMLTAYVVDNQRRWDSMLQKIACAIRTSQHEATKLSPFFVNFGHEHVPSGDCYLQRLTEDQQLPVDPATKARELEVVYRDVTKRLKLAHERSKHRYDLRRREIVLNVGDKVYRRNHVLSQGANYFSAKLAPKFVGPLTIKKKLSPTTYELEDCYCC